MSYNGKYKWISIILLSLGHFFSDFYNNFLPILLPFIVLKLNLSLTLSGIIVMVYMVISNMLQPIFGYFVDRKELTWVLLWTLPISAVFICFIALIDNLGLLLVCLTFAAIGSSLFHPIGTSMLGKLAPEENKSTAMALFIGGGNFGFAIAPAAIVFFMYHFAIESLLLLAIPAFFLSLFYFQQSLHKIKLSMPRNEENSRWYKSFSLWQLNVLMALKCCVQVSLPTFLPLLWVQQGIDSVTIGNVLTIFFIGAAVGGLVGGWIGDKIGNKPIIVLALGLSIPVLYAFIVGGMSIHSGFLLALIGGLLQGTMPSSIIWAQRILPSNAAMASGMMLGLSFGVGSIGTAITGVIADYIGIYHALLIQLVPLGFAWILAYFTPYKKIDFSSQELQTKNIVQKNTSG